MQAHLALERLCVSKFVNYEGKIFWQGRAYFICAELGAVEVRAVE